MLNKFKPVLILLSVLAALCVALAVVSVVNSQRGSEADTTPEADNTTVTVLTLDSASVTYLSYTHDNDGDGNAEELEFLVGSDDKTWYWQENTKLKLQEGIISTFAANLNGITSSQTFKNVSAEQLRKFGFDAPSKYLTVRDKINGEQSLTFGAYNSYNDCYYVYRNDDSKTVYMIPSAIFTGLETSVESFVYLDTFPEIEEEGLVSISYKDGEREVVCRFIAPEAGNTAEGVWERSVNGGEFVTVPDELSQLLTSHVTGMEYLACSTVYADKLSKYGFEVKDGAVLGKAELTVNYRTLERIWDEETEEVIKKWTDQSFTIKLGDLNSYNYYYVNPEGTEIAVMLGGVSYYKVFMLTDAELAAEK